MVVVCNGEVVHSSVSWRRRGGAATRGPVLRLSPALPHDAGHYACSVTAPSGPAATRDVEIQVRSESLRTSILLFQRMCAIMMPRDED